MMEGIAVGGVALTWGLAQCFSIKALGVERNIFGQRLDCDAY